ACVDAVVAGWPLLASPYSVRRLAAGLERSRSRSWAPQARRRGELRVPAAVLGQSIEWRPRFNRWTLGAGARLEALLVRVRALGNGARAADKAYHQRCVGLPESGLEPAQALSLCRAPLRQEVRSAFQRGWAKTLLSSLRAEPDGGD
ncbi:MAG: hypothetical protein AAGA57_12180, partial [Planctomycetota bacterium]